MRWMILLAVGLLVGCGSKDTPAAKPESGAASFAAAQAVVDKIAGEHPDLKRLTLHAVPTGKDQCTQVASTMEARRGKPSDPEDLRALETGEEVLLDEDGAVDLTVPILMVDGKPGAVAGVTVAAGEDHDAAVAEARSIAKALEAAVQASDKPLW